MGAGFPKGKVFFHLLCDSSAVLPDLFANSLKGQPVVQTVFNDDSFLQKEMLVLCHCVFLPTNTGEQQ